MPKITTFLKSCQHRPSTRLCIHNRSHIHSSSSSFSFFPRCRWYKIFPIVMYLGMCSRYVCPWRANEAGHACQTSQPKIRRDVNITSPHHHHHHHVHSLFFTYTHTCKVCTIFIPVANHPFIDERRKK